MAFHDVIQACRKTGVIPDNADKIIRAKRSDEELVEALESWFDRCVSPHTFTNFPSQLKLIRTAKELTSIALRHRNCLCLAKYKIALGTGNSIFLLFDDGNLEAVISLMAGQNGAWSIDEFTYSDGSNAGRVGREHIVQELARCGIKANARSFSDAWSEFAQSEHMPFIEVL